MSGTNVGTTDIGTALTQLTAAKPGMKRIPLAWESYQHQSAPLSLKKLMNQFAEAQPADAQNVSALLPTPGLETYMAAGGGPIHAINDDLPGIIYFVSGTQLFSSSFVGDPPVNTITFRGDIGTPSGGYIPGQRRVSIAVGPTAVVVCVPPFAYTAPHGSNVSKITTTWPDYGASSVAYLDGYFVFTGQMAPQYMFITRLLDPTTVDALDFAALDAFPNAMLKVVSLKTDLWFFGASGIEIWWNAGNQNFPFRRRPNAAFQRGVGAGESIAKGDESVFWWSQDGRVYTAGALSGGYRAKRISTHAIETGIGGESIYDSFVYNYFGHIFYVLNQLHRSWVYDTLTDKWHNWSSAADGSTRFNGQCCTAYTGFPLIGSLNSNVVMATNPNLSTDMGVEPLRQIVLPPIYATTKRAFCARLEVEMEVGGPDTPGTITLDWSDDGGRNWLGGPRVMSVGSVTETRKRVYATRLGSFRQRMFRLTARHALMIYGVDADIVAGNT